MTQPPGETPDTGPPTAGGGEPFTLSEAFNYGWKKFQEYLQPILIGILALIVLGAVIAVVWTVIVAGFGVLADEGEAVGFIGLLVSTALFVLVAFFIQFIIQAGITRAALEITKGEPIDVATVLSTDQLGQVIIASILIGLGTAIGSLLCFIPGLIVAFFSQFTMQFIIDKKLGAVDAIKASFGMVNSYLGSTVALYLGVLVATAIGAALCGVGLIVALPVAFIATTYAYRRMNGETVAA